MLKGIGDAVRRGWGPGLKTYRASLPGFHRNTVYGLPDI